MRVFSLMAAGAVLVLCGAAAAGPAVASAAASPGVDAGAAVRAQQDGQGVEVAVDSNDDTRVKVQLVVLGAAVVLVVVVGMGAYVLRRKLGLTAFAPEKDAGGHH